MMRWFFIGLIGCISTVSSAQDIRLFWDSDTAVVGEPVQLNLLIRNKPDDLEYRPLSGELACESQHTNSNLWISGASLEIQSFEDTVYKEGGNTYWKGVYKVIAWDSASYRVFPLWFVKKDSSFNRSVPVLHVTFQKKKVETGIEEIPVNPYSDYWFWFRKYGWMVLVAIAIIVLAILWNKRKRVKPADRLTLRERTLLAIGEIRKKEDWLNGHEKEYYSAFSAILKAYIGARYELNLLERTTWETKVLLQQKGLNPILIGRINELLLQADLVKFAKGKTDDLEARSALRKLEELVIELSPLEIPS